jgi:hypothetical protein
MSPCRYPYSLGRRVGVLYTSADTPASAYLEAAGENALPHRKDDPGPVAGPASAGDLHRNNPLLQL